MTSSRSKKALLAFLAVCLGVFIGPVPFSGAHAAVVPQREVIPPDSDYMLRKDSAAIDAIKAKETDPQKMADAMLTWAKEHPQATRAISRAASYYGEVVASVLKAGDAQKALAMIQAFQTAAPKDATLVLYQMQAYYQAKNYAKAAEIGEKLYAEKPNLDMANALYGLYVSLNNQDKILTYGEKIVADIPIDKSFNVALQLANIYVQRKSAEKALHYLTEVMNVYGDKVPPGIQEPAWNATRAFAFSMMAADSYTKNDLAKATELYEKVTGFAPKGEEACTAWYYIGMAKWRGKDQKGAIEPFAKSFVLGKAMSAKAKENLDNLWKAEHNNTLDGLDAVIAKAKSDLGIG